MGKTEGLEQQETQQADHIWCTSCGRILPKDSVYCEFCGSRIERELEKASAGGEKQPEKQKSDSAYRTAYRIEYRDEKGGFGFLRRLGWKKAAAAGMMAACGLVLSAAWVSGRQAGEKGQPLLGYIKDNSLFVLEENGESREISDICLRDWKNREQLRLPEAADWIPFYYEEAGALWYPEQVGDGAFSLMNGSGGNAWKADSSAVSVQTAGETAVYEKANSGLYLYSGGRKKKLTAGAASYQLSEKGDYLIWQEEHPDQTTGLYGVSLDKKGQAAEEELLERDAEFLGASGDLTRILYKKEGELWLLENHSEKKCLAQNVNQVFLSGQEEKTLFFTRQENEGESLYVLSGKQAGNERTERLLDPEFLFLIHEEDGILTYKASGEAGEEIRIASSEAYAALDCNPEEEISVAVSGDYGWYLASPEPGADQALYRVSLEPEQFGSAEEAAQQADRFCGQCEGTPFYLSDLYEQTGDLYFGEQAVSYDVKADSVWLEKNRDGADTDVYFLSDYDAQRESGVLTRYSGKDRRAEEIDGSASGYLAVSGKLLYFTDYDPARGQGTLKLYEEGKTQEIDSGVWAAYGRSGDEAAFIRKIQADGVE